MKKHTLLAAGGILLLLLSFQNCAPTTFVDDGLEQQASLGITPNLNCGIHPDQSTWFEKSSDVISEQKTCEFGGQREYQYEKSIEMTCINGVPQPTGEIEKGNLVSFTDTCQAPTCDGRPDGSTWNTVNGTVSEKESCPSSTVQIDAVYENVDQYVCRLTQTVKTGSIKGNFVGRTGACPAPTITAVFDKATVAPGSQAQLLTTTSAVSTLTYACTNGQSGSLPLTPTSTAVRADQDISCTVTGINSAGVKTQAEVSLSLECGLDEVKSGGKCVPFSCKSFVPVSQFPVSIPARTSAGVCYYVKIFDAIASAPSTGAQLNSVLSRRHGGNSVATDVGAPYILGQKTLQFQLSGARQVKLSGSPSKLDSIRVDNYLLVGNRAVGDTEFSYRSYGTLDSVIASTGYIQVNGKNVSLAGFGPAGTATVGALTIANQSDIVPNKLLELSVDALDCGGSRELSDVYMVFY